MCGVPRPHCRDRLRTVHSRGSRTAVQTRGVKRNRTSSDRITIANSGPSESEQGQASLENITLLSGGLLPRRLTLCAGMFDD